MKRIIFSITTLIIVTSLVACTKHIPETSVNKLEVHTTVTSKTSTESFVSVINAETTSAKKAEKRVTTRELTTEKFSETTVQTTSIVTTKPTTTKAETPKATTSKPETTKVVPTLPSYTPEEEMIELFNAVNNYRAENGTNKLLLDPEICKLAYIRAQEQNVILGHNRPDGTKFHTVFSQISHNYKGCSENIAIIIENSSEAALNGWKNSPPHNAAMLNPKYIRTGIALYPLDDGRYAVIQLFAF